MDEDIDRSEPSFPLRGSDYPHVLHFTSSKAPSTKGPTPKKTTVPLSVGTHHDSRRLQHDRLEDQ